ncbi:MAG: hypothetical protein EXR99_02595 [Gemmataceae bacterium]|nr:hypothetical protein [Gemmataceae bacterium]
MVVQTQHELIRLALLLLLENPQGLPLFPTGQGLGLFPKNSLGKQAAKAALSQIWITQKHGCEDEGFLFQPAPRGLAWLLESNCVVPILKACLAFLPKVNQDSETGKVLTPLQNALRLFFAGKDQQGQAGLPQSVLKELHLWRNSRALGDFPLDRLFQIIRDRFPGLPIGAFHDALRQLAREKFIELHPWTGPLYQIPSPELALLTGHEIAYYASASGEVKEYSTSPSCEKTLDVYLEQPS